MYREVVSSSSVGGGDASEQIKILYGNPSQFDEREFLVGELFLMLQPEKNFPSFAREWKLDLVKSSIKARWKFFVLALFRLFTPESNRWIIYISISDEYLIMIWEHC